MAFPLGHKAYRTKDQYAKADKSFFYSEEYRKKQREIQKNHWKDHPERKINLSKYQLGRKRSKEIGKKISKATKGKLRVNFRGEKHWHWKGGYENTLMLNRQRYWLKKGNGGFHNLAEWEILKAQYNWTCLYCRRKEPEIKLTEDNIIPLSKGGSSNIENIQPLCGSCNARKYNNIDDIPDNLE